MGFCLRSSKVGPVMGFCSRSIRKGSLFIIRDKIKQNIENASALEKLLPPKGGPNFKYNIEDGREGMEGCTLYKEFSSMIRARKTAHEITSWVEEYQISLHGSNVALEVVIQTLLDVGSKSFQSFNHAFGEIWSGHI